MSNHFHAVVWIDHHQARVFHFKVAEVDQQVLRPHDPPHQIHHKANSVGSGHAAEDHAYLQHVADTVAGAGAVLILGPANAKTELVKHIAHNMPLLKAKIAGVETVDHLTDGEIVAHARNHFKADHQLPPRTRA